MPTDKPTYRVLFVCLGNICRSPAAEIIFRKQVTDAGHAAEFEIDSCGTIGHHQGSPPDSRMAETLRQKGYTVKGSARQIQTADLENFDLIVTMDETNLADVRQLARTAGSESKVRPFMSFCRHHDDLRVPDPYYGGQRGFDHVIRLLEDGCEGILEELKK
jgi:protein-tyrosine phosphatase